MRRDNLLQRHVDGGRVFNSRCRRVATLEIGVVSVERSFPRLIVPARSLADCFSDAGMESFFASLKKELAYQSTTESTTAGPAHEQQDPFRY